MSVLFSIIKRVAEPAPQAPGNLCLLGSLPTAADFALYGQLSQLVVDNTPDRQGESVR